MLLNDAVRQVVAITIHFNKSFNFVVINTYGVSRFNIFSRLCLSDVHSNFSITPVVVVA